MLKYRQVQNTNCWSGSFVFPDKLDQYYDELACTSSQCLKKKKKNLLNKDLKVTPSCFLMALAVITEIEILILQVF